MHYYYYYYCRFFTVREANGFLEWKVMCTCHFHIEKSIEERLELNCETHLPFVDWTKAFNNVKKDMEMKFMRSTLGCTCLLYTSRCV